MSALGSLVVNLSLEYAAYTKGLDKSSQEALKFASKSQKAFDNASNALGTMVKGVLAAGTAYLTMSKGIEAVNESINGLAALDDLSQKTGSSVENLSRMQKVAKQFGGDFAQVDVALSKLAKGMASVDSETNKAHHALAALNLTDFSKTHDASEVMVEVAKRLQGYRDGAGKAALATDLFGKSGADLLPYLNDMAENIDKVTGASSRSAKMATEFQDKVGGLKLKIGELFQGIAIDLLRALNPVIDVFNDAARASKDMTDDRSARNWADELVLAGARVYDTFNNVWQLIKALTGSFKVVYADIEVIGAASKLANPAALAASIAAGQNPYKDLAAAKAARDKTLAAANAAYAALAGADRSAAENALLAKFTERGVDAHTAALARNPNASLANLDYQTGNASNNAASAAQKAEQDRLAAWQKAFDAKKAQDIKWFEDELEFEEYYKKQKIKDEEELAKEKAETQKRWFELEQKNIDAAQKEREDALDKLQKQNDEFWNSIEGTAHKVWTDVWEGGSNAFKNIGQTIKSAILDLLYQITIKKWIIGISASVTAGGAGSALASSVDAVSGVSGSAGGLGGLLSGGSSIMNLIQGGNQAIVSSIESLGTFLSTGTGGLGDLLGGALGKYAGTISNVLPFAGAAFNLLTGNVKGAIGSALGAALTFTPLGPVGGIVGGLVGSALGGLFGGKKLPPRITASQSGIYQDGIFSSAKGAEYGKSIAGADGALNNLNETFSRNLAALLKGFGLDATFNTQSVITKKKSYETSFGGSINGQGFFTYQKFDKKANMQDVLNSVVEYALGPTLVKAIQASSLSDGVKKFFNGLADKTVVNDVINTLVGLNAALKDLPPVFDAIRNAIETTGYSTSIADLKTRFAAVQTYTSLFYTQQEQFDTFTRQLTSQFDALNTVVPKSRDEYRKLVDGIKVSDESTSNLFHGLVALAPAMDQFYKQIEALTTATDNAVSRDSFSSLLDAQRYAGVSANYGSTFASDYTSNLNAGRIMVGQNGVATTASGNNDLLTQIKLLRTATEAVVVYSSKQLDELRKFYTQSLPVTVVTP